MLNEILPEHHTNGNINLEEITTGRGEVRNGDVLSTGIYMSDVCQI